MQNMWISVVLIVLIIVIGLVAGTRLSAPGPQRRAIYSAFGALAVLAIWFFVFIAFFPADWIVPFFTVACIVVPICIYVGVARGSQGKKMKAAGDIKIPKGKSVDTIKADQPQGPKPPAKPAKPAKSTAAPAAATAVAAKSPSPGTKSATPAATSSKPAATVTKTTAAAQASQKAATPTQQEARSTTSESTKRIPQKQDASASATPTAPAPKAEPVRETPQKKESQRPAASVDTSTTPVDSQESQQIIAETAVEAMAETAVEKPLVTQQAEEERTSATSSPAASAADIDILVNKTIAEEIDELEELVRPFGTSELAPEDPGPELNVGAPIDVPAPTSKSEAEQTSETGTRPASTTPANQQTAVEPGTETRPVPAPAKKPPKKQPTPAEQFAGFCKKASLLRAQGSFAVAALLYEKAANIAPSANERRNALFEELSCYVKADDIPKAKAIAARLRQSSVLTRFERIKLDAVERMS